MKSISVGEFRAHFSEIVEQVKAGEKFTVTFGRKKEIVGYFSPEIPEQPKRKLGIMEGKAKAILSPGLK